jgi:phosphoserine phosphatase
VASFAHYAKGKPYGEVADAAGEVIEEKKHRIYRYTRDLVTDLKKRGYYLLPHYGCMVYFKGLTLY